MIGTTIIMPLKKHTVLSPPYMVDDVLFDMVHHRELNESYGIHQHDCIEIGIIYGGRARHLIGDEVRDLQAGDVFIIHPGCGHRLFDCKKLDQVTISCSPQIIERLGVNLSFIFGIREILSPESRRFAIFFLNRSELTDAQKIFSAMQNAYQRNKDEEKGNLRSYFAMFLCLLAQAYSLHHNSDSALSRINRVLNFMNEHFREPLTLPQLAAKANLSVCEFGRVFKKQYGITPIKYILELRLNESMRLLHYSNLSIAEIAYTVGIEDSNYFSKIFRKRFDVSPRQARNQSAIEG